MIADDNLLLNGDLNQMGTQKRFLQSHGFSVGQTDVYPTIEKEDVVRALGTMWLNKVNGWWNYQLDFTKYSICTDQEFKEALRLNVG